MNLKYTDGTFYNVDNADEDNNNEYTQNWALFFYIDCFL